MRTHKLTIIALILASTIFFITISQAYPKQVCITAIVKNSEYPFDPINGANVEVELLEGSHPTWSLQTDSTGETTECVETILDTTSNPHLFSLDVSATGFQSVTNVQRSVNVNVVEENYDFTVISLDPVGTPACNDGNDNDGDGLIDYPEDPGCESASDTSEEGGAPTQGVIKSIDITTSPQCLEDYSNKGSWTPSIGGQHILCAEHLPELSGTQDVIENAVLEEVGGSTFCEGWEYHGEGFAAGGPSSPSYVLCYNITSLDSDQLLYEPHVIDIMVKEGGCPITYQIESPPFFDEEDNIFHMCTAIRNYAPSTHGDCDLPEKPQWVNSSGEEHTNIVGWINDQDYIHGDEIYMYVKAPGCYNDAIKIEVWEGEKDSTSESFNKHESTTLLSEIPAEQFRQGEYAFLLWPKPDWFEKDEIGISEGSPRTYYFKAKVGSDLETEWSNPLTVNKPEEAECNYNPNIREDDERCIERFGPGQICVFGNKCEGFSCLEEGQECEDGFCDDEEGSLTYGQCIQCYTTEECQNNPDYGEYADLYTCGEDENDPATFRMCDPGECVFKNLEFRDRETRQELLTAIGWLPPKGGDNYEYIHGNEIIFYGESVGCDHITDLRFVIREINELIIFQNEETFADVEATKLGNSGVYTYIAWKPDWKPDILDLLDANSFRYKFYAASASDLETPLGEQSGTLEVIMPANAECDYDEEDINANYENCEEGLRCNSENRCVPLCNPEAEETGCEEDYVCSDGSVEGTLEGLCYLCLEHSSCEEEDGEERYCSGEPSFQCVECTENEHCEGAIDGEDGVCSENECTLTCETNDDCTLFREYDAQEIEEMSTAERAENREKLVCDTSTDPGTCVECTANYDPDASDDICEEGGCCYEGTACIIEENVCVECTEDWQVNCGFGTYCDPETHECTTGFGEGGLFGEGGAGGIIAALGGALIGFFVSGPMGAMIGGLGGLLLGGGLGGGEGGGAGMLSIIGDLFGGLFNIIPILIK